MTAEPQWYRKLPVEIQAMEWQGSPMEASYIIDWVLREGGTARYDDHLLFGEAIHIDTLEGITVASPGDFIIKGVAGEFYACKPDIFAKTYEAA